MPSARPTRLHVSAALPFDFEAVPVPRELAELINAFYVVRTRSGVIEDFMPAYSAQILVFGSGGMAIHGKDGTRYEAGTIACTAPMLTAHPITVTGPVVAVGASLTPLGWNCLSCAPADEVHDRFVPPEAVLSEATRAALEALAGQACEDEAHAAAICARIAGEVSARAGKLSASHVRVVGKITAWLASGLNPPIEALYADVAISPRSVQRIARRYFGVPPTRLLKRYRAMRAAMLLANPDLDQGLRDTILAAYFDQAHLIRDIRRYTGRTPSEVSGESLMVETLAPEAHGIGARILRPGD